MLPVCGGLLIEAPFTLNLSMLTTFTISGAKTQGGQKEKNEGNVLKPKGDRKIDTAIHVFLFTVRAAQFDQITLLVPHYSAHVWFLHTQNRRWQEKICHIAVLIIIIYTC